MSRDNPDMNDVEAILSDRSSRYYRDLQDRAAYVYITGAYPTHLRPYFTRVLTMISKPSDRGIALDLEIAARLRLEEHPMVRKVQAYIRDGYKIRVSKGVNARKPYSKVLLYKGDDRRTVQIDGSLKDGWD